MRTHYWNWFAYTLLELHRLCCCCCCCLLVFVPQAANSSYCMLISCLLFEEIVEWRDLFISFFSFALLLIVVLHIFPTYTLIIFLKKLWFFMVGYALLAMFSASVVVWTVLLWNFIDSFMVQLKLGNFLCCIRFLILSFNCK